RVDTVAMSERSVERDARPQRLDGFIARVGKRRCRTEADSGSSIAEGKICRVLELQRCLQIDAGAWNNHTLSIYMGTLESRRKVDASSGGTSAAHGSNGHGLLVHGSANR